MINITDPHLHPIVNTLKFGFEFDGTSSILNDNNSSILTRLNLWRTSGKMIFHNPVNGIGAGTWDLLKMDYGFKQNILIDSHNGYLTFLSEYGLILGSCLLMFLYLELRYISFYLKSKQAAIGILVFYSICELSNSGTLRPQIFCLIVFVVLFLKKFRIEHYD